MCLFKPMLSIAAAFVGVATPVAAVIPGDVNGDGVVQNLDYEAFANCMIGPASEATPECLALDLDADGDLDLSDFATLARHWRNVLCTAAASASSTENNDPNLDAAMAVDGSLATRWSSAFDDDEWIQIDFGRERLFDGVTIHWETAYAASYEVLVSADGASWVVVHSTTSGDGGLDAITFGQLTARYLRIHCLARATEWGNSIWEIALRPADRCYVPGPQDVDERIENLIGAMTLEEKTSFVHGDNVMSLRSISRLGIPALRLADGPLGCRDGPSTAFPAPIAQAASWDVELVGRFGIAMGKEFRNKGRHVWLGPGMNLIRVPQCGRNFEYYSEDPFLASRMAVAAITGAQSQNVVACAKHFVANNQEYERTTVNVAVDERTLRELYLPAFESAVREAGVRSVMTAYNRVNGPHCTASTLLQTDILKDEWGFEGFVVSDWGAVHETAVPANAGLDLEMDGATPTGAFWGDGQLLAAVQDGQVSEVVVNEMVRRILRALFFTGMMDEPWDAPNDELVEHRALVREIAGKGIVLLKHDGAVLPLDKNATQTIAVLGSNYAVGRHGGGGSSYVSPYYVVSPLQGLRDVAGTNTTFVVEPGVAGGDGNYAPAPTSYLTTPDGSQNGLVGAYFGNTSLTGAPTFTRVDALVNFYWGGGSPGAGIGNDSFSARWTGKLTVPTTGQWDVGMASDDGCRVYLNGDLIVDDWTDHALALHSATVPLEAGVPYDIVCEYYENGGEATAVLVCNNVSSALEAAILAAQSADTALIFVGLDASREGEGWDRSSIDLTSGEIALIQAVASVNPRTAVIVVAGSQVGMGEWIDDVSTALQAWYGGQEAGHGIADVIFGEVNPGAKLPMTFVRSWNDHPASGLYPSGVYSDGLNVGYRYFDQADAAPLFSFGHGLSYTTFAYSDLSVDDGDIATSGLVRVSVDVENTGARGGAEVVQLYVRDVLASVSRPVKELKGFAKVVLAPGERKTVTLELNDRSFAYYEVPNARWAVEPGQFQILIGASSDDIRLSAMLTHP